VSSKPSLEGVQRLRELLKERRGLSAEVIDLRQKTARLKDAEAELSKNFHAIVEILKNMDAQSTGNFGWEARLVWLLGELDRQAMELTPDADRAQPDPPG
jgi:hypothetical protein